MALFKDLNIVYTFFCRFLFLAVFISQSARWSMNLGIDKDGLSDRDRINPGRPYKDLLIKSYGIDRALKMLNSGVNRADEVRLRKDKADFQLSTPPLYTVAQCILYTTPMVVAITLFLGTLFPLIELFTVFVILYFAVRLVGYPIKSYWSVLLSLVQYMHFETVQATLFVLMLSMALQFAVIVYRYFKDC